MELKGLKGLRLAFVVMGFCSTVGQVLIAREFMNVFSGNELILGGMFASWLVATAIGSWGLGKLLGGRGNGVKLLPLVLCLIAVAMPLQILLVRSMAGWIAVEKGEIVGLLTTLYAMFLTLLPSCSLYGLQFTLFCSLYSEYGESGGISAVYVLEAVGSVIGGLAFTFLLVHHLRVLEMSVGLSLLYLSTAVYLLSPLWGKPMQGVRGKAMTGLTLSLILLVASASLSGGLRFLDAFSYGWMWEGMDLVHSENSVYGNLAVTTVEGEYCFWENGLPYFTTPALDPVLAAEVAHFPMVMHPTPERVLLVGGGLGGVLEELLMHPVESITYVELDPAAITVAREFFPGASGILDDSRVDVVHRDGRRFVKEAEGGFDVVIVNLPPPSTLQLNRFYTQEFFEEVAAILDEDGILSIGVSSSSAHIPDEMASRNRCIYETLGAVFPSIVVVPGDFNIFVSSSAYIEGDPEVLCTRIAERGLNFSAFSPEYVEYKLAPERVDLGLAYLEVGAGEVNRDMRPVAVYHDIALWNSMFQLGSMGLFALLSELRLTWLFLTLSMLIVVIIVFRRRAELRRIPLYLVIFTTGLTDMAFSIVILYAYQAVCGYLYQELGVVSASFMLGLALGGWAMARRLRERAGGFSLLVRVELSIAVFSLLVSWAISLLPSAAYSWSAPTALRLFLPALNCAVGFLVGLEFPLAVSLMSSGEGGLGEAAGALYGLDLLGGCVGALATSIWLMPLHGVMGVGFVMSGLNVCSLAVIYVYAHG
jgi:spermidine synthase